MYDLHSHSHCSDGELSPTALVALAKAQGVKVLALTDHDTVAGITEATRAAGSELCVIPGIEFSSVWQGQSIHVVGLQVDIDCERLQRATQRQSSVRCQRAEVIAERLSKAGIPGVLEGAAHYAKGEIGRPHFARYMVDNGYVSSMDQAFKRYLGAGKVGDVKHGWPAIQCVIEWIYQAGGIAVLAHPDKYRMTRTKLRRLVTDFAAAGGEAIEVVSGVQAPSVTQKLAEIAASFNLLASCGSDFHSSAQGWQMLGKMSPLPATCRPIWGAPVFKV